jgi:hypothetical protein
MTKFNILTWNIENTGKSKQVIKPTAAARISYFAQVVKLTKANVVVFQEAVGGQSLIASIAADIVEAFNTESEPDNLFPKAVWTSSNTLRASFGGKRKRSENAWFFWNQSEVQPVLLNNSSNLPDLLGGSAFNNFPESSGVVNSYGRKAFFLAFYALGSQSQSCALVTTYHAPFTVDLDPQTKGLACLAAMLDPTNPDSIFQVYQLTTYFDNIVFMLCGDYNIDITSQQGRDLYENLLMSNTNTRPAVDAKTTLKTVESVNQTIYPNTEDYLANGYDNIFYSVDIENQLTQAWVVDLISVTTQDPLKLIAQGLLSELGRSGNNNIDNTNDSFKFYRKNISDHLPVFASFEVG